MKRWTGPPTASDPATYFYSDSSWNLLQEGSSATSIARTYVHGGRVDEIVACSPNVPVGQWYYHHNDARGHAILLTDVNGKSGRAIRLRRFSGTFISSMRRVAR